VFLYRLGDKEIDPIILAHLLVDQSPVAAPH
jgi:hypothetical protein